ncbi:MAG: PQQ-dependent sugar dehydrogenase [Vicinamibacteraceae bacterium]
MSHPKIARFGAALLSLAAAIPAGAQLRAVPYVTDLESPVGFESDPTDPARQYVLEREGRVRLVIDGELQATPFLDLTDVVGSDFGEQGLLGLAFAPDYATSRRFFVNFTREPVGHTVIARFERSQTNPNIADGDSGFDLVFGGVPYIEQPEANHNGGKMLFREDGYLYIAMGDGGGSNDPDNNAQNPATLLGKILRIDVDVPDEHPTGYVVPAGNPFVGDDQYGALDEIWAFGLRNPWRITEDLPALGGTGALLIGDVGQGAREEINYEPAGEGGRNYGWSVFEGAIETPGIDPNRLLAYEPATPSIHDYTRDSGESVIGGYVYRGLTLGAAYEGRYIFADLTGRVYSFELVIDPDTGEAVDVDDDSVTDHTRDLFGSNPPPITSVDVDAHGEPFIVGYDGTIYRVTLDEGDDDGDGLPDAWEQQFGLSTAVGRGDEGPYGDPDGDGFSNGEELRHGESPRDAPEPLVRLFAEGATNFFFDTELALVNPTGAPAHATLEYRRHDGEVFRQSVPLPAERRVTVDPREQLGLDGALFATSVRSESPLVVERSMRWPRGTDYGSHADAGVAAPAATWYLAEGHTAPFSLFYLLDNAGAEPAQVEVTYILPGGVPVIKPYTVAPHSRQTVFVNLEHPALLSTAVAASIQTSPETPITVERAMYLDGPDGVFGAGHETTAVTAPSNWWFFAEGATGDYFDMFLALANSDVEPAQVRVQYLLHGSGRAVTKVYSLPSLSRQTIYVDAEEVQGQSLANETVSIVITSDQLIMAERAMWWPGAAFDVTWREAHVVHGATEPALKWLTAGGENGGPTDRETFVLIGNVSDVDARVRVTLLFEGDDPPFVVEESVPARSRVTLPIRPEEDWPVADKRFAVLVESLPVGPEPAPLIVERATYSNAQGVFWAAGESTLATPVP